MCICICKFIFWFVVTIDFFKMSKLILLSEILNNFIFIRKYISENYFDHNRLLRCLNSFLFACEKESKQLGNDLATLYFKDRYKILKHLSTSAGDSAKAFIDVMLDKNIKLFSYLIKNIDKDFYQLSLDALLSLKLKAIQITLKMVSPF